MTATSVRKAVAAILAASLMLASIPSGATPSKPEKQRDQCGDRQNKILNRLQLCAIKGYLKGLAADDPVLGEEFISNCHEAATEQLTPLNKAYDGNCPQPDAHTSGIVSFMVFQTVCAMDFFIFGNNLDECTWNPAR